MKFYINILLTACLLSLSFITYKSSDQHTTAHLILTRHKVTLHHLEQEQQIEVRANDRLITTYHYSDTLEKPFLYPLNTLNGIPLTRGFPIDPQPGERVDHPHHVGLWMNYGNVNGLDFWNNSYAVPESRKDRYGTIRHSQIIAMEEVDDEANLVVAMDWLDPEGNVLLVEQTVFGFKCEDETCYITRTSNLQAVDDTVFMTDNKEGFLGIRVSKELEHKIDKPATLVGEDLKPTPEKMVDHTGVTGMYLSSEGMEGVEVWGTRARWMKLGGKKNGKNVSLTILDHPSNPGYPTYWHARGYGLFAANPLGQKIFSNDKEVFNFQLEPNESTTFKFQVLIHEGDSFSTEQIERAAKTFSKQ